MCTRRSLSTIAAALMLAVAAPAWAQQAGTNGAPVVSVQNAPHVQPQQPVVMDTQIGQNATEAQKRARLERQVASQLDQATRDSLQFQSALQDVQKQVASMQSRDDVAAPLNKLQRYQRNAATLHDEFEAVRQGFQKLDRPHDARKAGQMVSAMDDLQQRLALLGLELQKRGAKAREPNALEFNLSLLEQSLEELPQFVPAQFGGGPQNATIRPPQSVTPEQQVIQPSSGTVQPEQQVISPSSGTVAPEQQVIPPSSGTVAPEQQVIPPSSGTVAPEQQVIQPSSGTVAPEQQVIQPSTTVPSR